MEKKDINIDDVYNLIGDVNEKDIFEFLQLILNSDIKKLLEKVDSFYESGKNFINICDRLQLLIRNIIIYNNTNNYFDKEYEKELQLFSKVDIDKLLNVSEELFKLITELKKTNNQKIIMEIHMLKISLMFNNKKIDDNQNNVVNDDEIVNKEINKKDDNNIEDNKLKNEIKNIKINNALSRANKDLKKEFISKYNVIKEYVSNKEYNSLANLLLKCVPEVVSDKNIIFTFKNNFEVILFEKNEEEIVKFLKKVIGNKYSIVAVNEDEWLKIKEKYIKDTKNGIKYEYIEENINVKKSSKKSELESTVENLFGDDIIKVN